VEEWGLVELHRPRSFRGLGGCEDGPSAHLHGGGGAEPRTIPLGGGSLGRTVVVLFRALWLCRLITRSICSRKRDCCTPRRRRSNSVSFVSRSIMGLIGLSGAVGLWKRGARWLQEPVVAVNPGQGIGISATGGSGGLATTLRRASAGRWSPRQGYRIRPQAVCLLGISLRAGGGARRSNAC
jgi:hypothetical protein